jgi:hypothetical protein
MNKFTACVFPDTLPDEELTFPLVQVFGQLVHMQAVENEPLQPHIATPFIEHLQQQGVLNLFTPVPLGEQRERFLALTGDMKMRKDDYASQLSMLSLAGLNRRERTETKHSILASLLQRGNIAGKKEEEELLLWQSRLVLKLGEFFDAEQADLNNALRKISSRQDALLAELRDEEDMPFSLTTSLHESGSKPEGILHHRLRAWSRLYFHGAPPAEPQVFITRHLAAIDTLQEVYEKNHRQGVQQIAVLELAASDFQSSPQPLPLEPLIDQCPSLRSALAALTSHGTNQETELSKRFSDCAAEWSQCLAERYPTSQYGRCTLTLFLFPEATTQQLFLESFCRGDSFSENTTKSGSSPCIVGWMETNKST